MLIALLLAASALAQARAHLAQGKLDAVLLDLMEPGGNPAEEAALLTAAAESAKARRSPGDEPLALQLAQVAMRRDPTATRPLRLLGEWSFAAREFGQAHRFADLWLKAAPDDEAAKRFAFKVKLLDESWHPALLDPPKRRRGGLVAARHRPPPLEDLGAPYKESHAQKPIVTVYGTSWCPACRAAREYLARRHIAFNDLDLERDPEARRELAEKQARAQVHFGGVPVLEVNGTLLEGFDHCTVEDALLKE